VRSPCTDEYRWDNAEYDPLGSGSNNWVYSLSFGLDELLYVRGQFTKASGKRSSYIAQM
jgi:hypothetical protein